MQSKWIRQEIVDIVTFTLPKPDNDSEKIALITVTKKTPDLYEITARCDSICLEDSMNMTKRFVTQIVGVYKRHIEKELKALER